MKNLKLLTLLWTFLLIWTLAGCWSNNNEDFIVEDLTWEIKATIDYNDKLTSITYNCITSEEFIRNAYDDRSIEDVETAIENTISECTNAKKEIKKIWNWNGDSSLKDGVITVIEKEIEYCSKFKELLPYLEKEDVTEEENNKYENLLSEIKIIDDERKEANENIIAIQQEFAEKYWFELEWDEDTLEETDNESYGEADEETNEETDNEVENEGTTADEIEINHHK
jgi:hypothetical protein